MEFDLTGHNTGKDAKLWVPYPVSNQNQSITDIRVTGNFKESAVYTDNKNQTPILFARWEKDALSRQLTFSFNVSRQEVIRRNFLDKESAWDPRDYALHLTPTRLGPVDGDVKKLAQEITAGKDTVLEKAKAVYEWTCKNTYRNPKTRGCGTGNVCQLLKDPGGKCTDISSLFVALARAAGVPSREIFGIRQGKRPDEDITQWQHCWAEFYQPGYGWVPVDPGDVRKMMLKQNLKFTDSKTAEYRNYFWGGIDPYRIKLGHGRDLILNPPQKGEKINYLMYPFAQVGDKTLDWLEPESFKYKITYKQK